MLSFSNLSVENYDNLLVTLSEQTQLYDVWFWGPNLEYCYSYDERQTLIDDFNWQMADGGFSYGCINNIFLINHQKIHPKIILKTDILGKEFDDSYFKFLIYNDGSVEKNMFIK